MRKAYSAVLVMVCSLSWPLARTSAQTLDQRVAALEAKLDCVTVQGNELFVTGCNVHIRNGSNTTAVTNGLGNLILGYNVARQGQGSTDRAGSHNLVIGDEHFYTSAGGIVVGYQNAIRGASASVTGGTQNTAGGPYTSISGGAEHYAGGSQTSISGGFRNTTRGAYSTISGGEYNTATGHATIVTGGTLNTANGSFNSIVGGSNTTAR
jgi:hypothetical protein